MDELEKAPDRVSDLICDSPDYPELKVRWFHAIDIPLFDPLSSTSQDEDKYPIEWIPFSKRDSNALENAFKSGKTKDKIPVNEDFLFEVDIEDREIMPVYWSGPIYTVSRATWFLQDESNKIIPCDENLALQIEKGYIDQEAWVAPIEILGSDGNIKVIPRPEKKYNFTGRLESQYVIYNTPTTAWMLKDDLTGHISKSIFSRFTGGGNLGGVRLFRGYEEVETFTSKKPNVDKINDYDDDTPEARRRALEKKRQLQETEDFCVEASEEIREIDHLIFVIHGVGQKMCERSGYTNFVHEVNVLRKTLKRTYSANPPQECIARLPPNYEKKKYSQIGNGIQVLPIHWRQEIKFGMASEEDDTQGFDGECTLDDLTLDGVPGLRMFMSDVLMDVLLYMTPNYREQMLRTVTKEVNRVYNLFLERNPEFKEKGKVSIFGHSLGSLLAFDVLCHQPPLFNSSNAIFGIFDERSQHKVNGNDESEVKNYEEVVKLDFPVWNFFAAGSPIGLFLMLKGLKVGSRKYLVDPENGGESNNKKFMASTSIPYCYPAVKNIYNIFHRTDPIAYRLEPLVSHRYAKLDPALIPYNKGGLKAVTIGIGRKTTNIFSAVKTSLLFTKKSKTSSSSSSATNSRSGSMDISRKSLDLTRKQSSKVNDSSEMPSFENLSGADKLKSLNSTGRIDYCLQEGILDIAYITAITSHLNYWYDNDVAYFILKEVYGNIYDDVEDV
ncbi:3987_t:CDS:10 [Funneliformis geosporum]|uniref:3987_t:CDS:1 n=1 Tax=Funneliformis geosporum TaxID=1117311 RepID=A0A9W4SD49_9GLOM|nr:3987_t:CDS:10 [Funneliformis geosporum]